jgi:hypothetical protein
MNRGPGARERNKPDVVARSAQPPQDSRPDLSVKRQIGEPITRNGEVMDQDKLEYQAEDVLEARSYS